MALVDGLVAYWALEEESGTRFDSHGSNHLTDNNTVGDLPGISGTGANFEADNSESLSIASNATLTMGDIDFTLQCWVFHESLGSFQAYIAKVPQSLGSTWEYQVRVNNANTVQFAVADGENAVTVDGPTIEITTWYHIVAVHDAANDELRLYVNGGEPYVQESTIAPQTGNAIFRLGARGDTPSHFFDGRMDEVAIWKRALSPAEIADLYNNGNGRDYAYVSTAGSSNEYDITVEGASYTFTGSAAALKRAALLTAGEGNIALAGQAADFIHTQPAAYRLEAGTGAFVLTGQSAGSQRTYLLAASGTAFALHGQAASLLAGSGLVATGGSFTLAGQSAGLFVARLMTALAGNVAWAGKSAMLTWSGEEPLLTPPSRTFVVSREERTYRTPLEKRTYRTPLEKRTYVVE